MLECPLRVRNSGNARYTDLTLVPSSGLIAMTQGPSNCTFAELAPMETQSCNATFTLTMDDFTSDGMVIYLQVVASGATVWEAIRTANSTGGPFSLAYARNVEVHLSSWLEGARGGAAVRTYDAAICKSVRCSCGASLHVHMLMEALNSTRAEHHRLCLSLHSPYTTPVCASIVLPPQVSTLPFPCKWTIRAVCQPKPTCMLLHQLSSSTRPQPHRPST